MNKNRILVASLLSIVLISIGCVGLACKETEVVYYEGIGRFYYHNDPVCPIANKWNLPMTSVFRALLNHEPLKTLRPCMLCASLEREAYYDQVSTALSAQEIAAQQLEDERELRLLDRDHFTFEDWADLFPGTFLVPSESDISTEEAIRIARAAVVSAYGIDEDTVMKYHAPILCRPGVDYVDNNEKIFLIQFGTEKYPLLFNVYIQASTGQVKKAERMFIPPDEEQEEQNK